MKSWTLPILVSILAWWMSSLQHATSASSLRVARTPTNFSKFVHHDWEEVPTTTVSPLLCMADTNTTEPPPARRRRSDANLIRETSTMATTTRHEDANPVKMTRRRRANEDDDLETETISSIATEGDFEKENSTAILFDEGENPTVNLEETEREEMNSSMSVDLEDLYSEEFYNCAQHVPIEGVCIEWLSNGSIYIPIYERLFNVTDYFPIENTTSVYVCPTFFDTYEGNDTKDDTKFSPTLATVSMVGTAISTFCIVLHIGMFLTFQKLRNLPGYCLISMCVALLIAYTGLFIPYNRKEPSDCSAIGFMKAYGLLASFFWMNAMAYDIWRSLRMATAKLRLTGDRPMLARFAMYSAYSWGCPSVILIFGFILNSSNVKKEYRMDISNDTCWFTYKQALMMYFAAPLFTLLVLNVLLFMSSFFMISEATLNTAENKADLWSRFMVSIRLAVVMGLMWIFGVLATATEASWLWYLNVVCNVLQGVFIFFSFTLNNKTRQEVRKAVARKKSSVFPTLTSSQPSTSV